MLVPAPGPMKPLLQSVPPKTSPASLVYQLAAPFQLAPGVAALSVNVRQTSNGTIDFEGGANLVVLGPGLAPAAHIPVTRTAIEPHPRTGKPTHMVRGPMMPGFMPAGKGQNGGTGYAIAQVIGYPVHPPVRSWTQIPAEERFHAFELVQLEWTGETLQASEPVRIDDEGLVEGWRFNSPSLGPALPEGDGFLMGFTAQADSGVCQTGIMRWERKEGTWAPTSFTPVSGEIDSFEPSILRDTDGALLFSARGRGEHVEALRLWRSEDGGQTWELCIEQPKALAATPVTLNMGPGGQPYLAGNPWRGRDSQGEAINSIEMRERLLLWPLAPDRRSVLEPIVAHDLSEAFGPAPNGSIWRADHPISATLQLGDEAPRHWLFYRVLERNECISDAPATPQTGTFAQEIGTAV